MAATALISSRRRKRGDAPVSWDSNGLRRVQSRRSPGKCQSGGSTTTDSFRILHRDGLFVRYRQSRTYSANETKIAHTKKLDMRTKKPTTDENDLRALDRLAHCVTPPKLRPMTPQQRMRWEAADPSYFPRRCDSGWISGSKVRTIHRDKLIAPRFNENCRLRFPCPISISRRNGNTKHSAN